jgi:hypothetical protein
MPQSQFVITVAMAHIRNASDKLKNLVWIIENEILKLNPLLAPSAVEDLQPDNMFVDPHGHHLSATKITVDQTIETKTQKSSTSTGR